MNGAFRETQVFPLWAYLLNSAILVAIVLAYVPILREDRRWGHVAALAAVVLFMVFLDNLLVMRLEARPNDLLIQFGWLPIIRVSLEFKNLRPEGMEVARNISWLSGYGLRMLTDLPSGRPAIGYLAGSKAGVLVRGAQGDYLVGTTRPDDLLRVLSQRLTGDH